MSASADRYLSDGYCVLPGAIDTEELDALRAETAELIGSGPDREPASDFMSRDGVFFRVQFLPDKGDALLRTLAHPRILELVEELLGPDFTTYGTAMVFK